MRKKDYHDPHVLFINAAKGLAAANFVDYSKEPPNKQPNLEPEHIKTLISIEAKEFEKEIYFKQKRILEAKWNSNEIQKRLDANNKRIEKIDMYIANLFTNIPFRRFMEQCELWLFANQSRRLK